MISITHNLNVTNEILECKVMNTNYMFVFSLILNSAHI